MHYEGKKNKINETYFVAVPRYLLYYTRGTYAGKYNADCNYIFYSRCRFNIYFIYFFFHPNDRGGGPDENIKTI